MVEGSGACVVGCPTIVRFEEQPLPCLRCSGDEDRTTQSLRRPALSRALRAPGELLVDLSELVFADPSLMLDLAVLARRARHAGGAVRLCGAQPQILRLIEMMGLHRLPGVQVDAAPTARA